MFTGQANFFVDKWKTNRTTDKLTHSTMALKQFLALLLLSLFSCSMAQNDPDCVEGDLSEKIVTVPNEYGCAILECYNRTSNITLYDNYEFYGWILPEDLKVVTENDTEGRITVNVSSESWTLTVRNITTVDTGLYHCVLTSIQTGEFYLIRLGLNSKGPFFIDRWEMYRMNTIVGCSAFGGFLVLTAIIYLFWHFRYQSDEEIKGSSFGMVYDAYGEPTTGEKVVPNVYSNGSYTSNADQNSDVRKRYGYEAEKADGKPSQTPGVDNKAFTGDSNGITDKAVDSFFAQNEQPDSDRQVTTQL